MRNPKLAHILVNLHDTNQLKCIYFKTLFFNNIEGIASGRQSRGLRGSPDSVLYQFFFCEKRVMDIPPRKLTVRFWSIILGDCGIKLSGKRDPNWP